MVKDGIFYALGLGVVAAILWYLTGSITLVALPLVLALFFLQFFRNPKRRIPTEPGLVVSPADGVVTDVEWVETKNGSRLRLSVFLSVFDVHVNRAPVSGTVTAVEYRKGQFKNAMSREASLLNEQKTVAIDAGGYEVSFKLIAGLLARRIVCDLKVGDVLQRGQLIGMIKFGSRADILLPADAELKVAKGTRVKGGATILAVVPSVAELQANLSRAVGA